MTALSVSQVAARWLTLAEAAEHARISERTLRRLWTIGRVPPPTRVGRRLLYDRAVLDAALAGTNHTPSDPIMAAINAAKANHAALRPGRPRQG